MFGPIKRKPKEKEDPAEKQREQEETARVYAEFVKSFQVDDDRGPKKFVRGGVIDPNKTLGDAFQDPNDNASKTKFYKSTAKKEIWLPSSAESLQNRQTLARRTVATGASGLSVTSTLDKHTTIRTELGKGIGGLDGLTSSAELTSSGQRTREIDTFLEELKRKQELVDQRKQLRQVANNVGVEDAEREGAKQKLEFIESQTRGRGSIPGVVEAEETTNLYLGNLSPEITEEFLCQQFGNFGNITSVKIMYPRSDEERARRRHCGFVSFETRDMAEAAKNCLDGEDFFGMPIRIGWGKAVSRPNLATATPLTAGVSAVAGAPLPVPLAPRLKTGLSGFSDSPPEKLNQSEANIYVHIPKDRRQAAVIDLVAQYVAEDGYTFEQLLIDKQRDNELFRFLSNTDTELGDYYRWRIYSHAQGDTLRSWRVEPYYMFSGGRQWHPPSANYFEDRRNDKRPSNFSNRVEVARDGHFESGGRGKNANSRGTRRLDEESREELENHLRHLTRERSSVLNAMIFCLDHSEYALEIVECLMESLTIEKTPIDTKIARLYLLSDILYNLSSSRQPTWAYRSALQRFLPEIFTHHNRVLRTLSGKLTTQAMKDRVMSVLRVWEDWAIYPPLFTKGLEASFLKDDKLLQDVFSTAVEPLSIDHPSYNAEVDGTPLADLSTLAKFPFWIRESVREWNALDLSHLEALCFRRGLSVSPEPPPTSGDNKSKQQRVPGEPRAQENQESCSSDTSPSTVKTKHHRPDVSYSHMRQLLIKRLVECEAYWRNRQIQNAKAFQVLDQESTSQQPAKAVHNSSVSAQSGSLSDDIAAAEPDTVTPPLTAA